MPKGVQTVPDWQRQGRQAGWARASALPRVEATKNAPHVRLNSQGPRNQRQAPAIASIRVTPVSADKKIVRATQSDKKRAGGRRKEEEIATRAQRLGNQKM